MWGFCKADQIETVQLQFCKCLLCIKQCTQNDFVYGELGLSSLQNKRFYMIIKYWLKIVFIMKINILNMMLQDIDMMPEKENWAVLVER